MSESRDTVYPLNTENQIHGKPHEGLVQTEDAKGAQNMLELERSDSKIEEEKKCDEVANQQEVAQMRDQQASHQNQRNETESEFMEPQISDQNSNLDHGHQQLAQDQTVSKDPGVSAQGVDNSDKEPDATKNQVQTNNVGGSTDASQMSPVKN